METKRRLFAVGNLSLLHNKLNPDLADQIGTNRLRESEGFDFYKLRGALIPDNFWEHWIAENDENGIYC